ncbi:Bis-ABC ATPase YheS [hydrothermal vent metagenome]|uniref:Bis-ABC ATPase YheS n=1 Tax=hydrothermal vent metagenome TaxID=652676 RepID=A0A3B0ZRN0_9ZZZZ
MLNFKSVVLRRGPNILIDDASLMIPVAAKVGVIGANGCGKSTLFALIKDELHVDQGEYSHPQNWVIAHVAQETPAAERAAIDAVLDGDCELRQLERQLADSNAEDDALRIAQLHERMDEIGAYAARSRAASLMHGLGFSNQDIENPVNSFSGGWRMRLNLAQALMCRSDLLLLDEPTNHLDLDAVIWLESWLRSYQGTLLLISHDREFLDRCIDRVIHIERQKINLYTGNYSQFEMIRAEKLAQQQACYVKQQREIEHMQDFVRRFKAKASKAKQAQSRVKALERMEEIAPAHVDSPFHFSFPEFKHIASPLLRLEKAAVGYANEPVIRNVNISIEAGARIGLIGPNGAGKSTLIKALAGDLPLIQGESLPAKGLKIGYFAQHQLEQLHDTDSPFDHLRRLDTKLTDQIGRDFLGGFNFQGDRVYEPIAPFSGGEKARLVLALLVYQQPNLLLFDEPTNHLDLDMRYALTAALGQYEGAMVVVSHDRHLIRTCTDTLLLVAEGKVVEFDGDIEDYRLWLNKQAKQEDSGTEETNENSAVSKKQKRQREAHRRQKLQPMRNKVKKLDKQLHALAEQKKQLEIELADPDLYAEANKDKAKQLVRAQADLESELIQVEEAWFEASEELELAEQEM